MSVALSQISKQSKSRHKPKVCAICGKKETSHWLQHWQNQHPEEEKEEWIPDQPLKGEAYCTNWKEIAASSEKIELIGLLPQFQRSSGSKHSQKGSVRGSVAGSKRGGSSIASQSLRGDDIHMEDVNQEEEKQGAVQNFGELGSNNILGKRSPTSQPQPLEEQVQRDIQLDDMIGAPPPKGPQSKRAKSNSNFAANNPALAGIQNGLSAKSLNQLPQSSLQQKQQIPKRDDEFQVPDPVPQTVYVPQGMRDGEAINKLKDINQKKDGDTDEQVAALIKLAPFFAQQMVSSFIEQQKHNLTHIQDLLVQAQVRVDYLKVEEISAIAVASIAFGGSCWSSFPKAFNLLEPENLNEVLSCLTPYLIVRFGEAQAKWFCANWRYLESQTLLLMRYLKEQSLDGTVIANICTISTMVKIEKVDGFTTYIEFFLRCPAALLVLTSIHIHAPQWKPDSKLSYDDFKELGRFLTLSENKYLIMAKGKELPELPLCQWMGILNTAKAASQINDVDSVQYRLDQLQQLYTPLHKSHAIDLHHIGDSRFKRVLHNVTNPPNALQFANAQYAAFSLKTYSKQLWCIPSGQGKSRTLATIALILLLTNSTTKVHLVYDSDHLMKRDQKEFLPWFRLCSIDQQIQFNVGMNFDCLPGEIILIDEADALILTDPDTFAKKIQHHKCICLTATPDDEDSQGLERDILKLMNFHIINGQSTKPAATDTTSTKELQSSIQTLTCAANSEELVSFIQKEVIENAVICYCSPEFLQLLNAANLPITLMQDGENITDEFLRTLDNRTGPNDTHTLIMATGSFGMRGFDYRSQSKGITLIIAASFSNQRQAMQGLCRVGRFGDKCKRYIASNIPLIDMNEQEQYRKSLLKYLDENEKTKLTVKLALEERKKPATATTRTNTARSTPAVGKSRKAQQQQSTGSQSTLTMLPQKDLSKRQVHLLTGKPATLIPPTQKAQTEDKAEKKEVEEEEDSEEIVITDSQMLGI